MRSPWFVSLRAQYRLYPGADAAQPWQHFCGGSLIAPDAVITSAHCLNDTPDTGNPSLHSDDAIQANVGSYSRFDPKSGVCSFDSLFGLTMYRATFSYTVTS